MCNACGFMCCALDTFDGCGCDHCGHPDCAAPCFNCGDPDCDFDCDGDYDDMPDDFEFGVP